MYQDEVEVFLKSSEPSRNYRHEVTLEITAFLRDNGFFDANTLTFRCDPVGSNYTSSYLQVTFDDWSKIIEIRNFLSDCFADDTIRRRAMTIEIEDGVSFITPYDEPPNETEGLDEITIEVDGDRIEFMRSGTLLPYIFTYEEKSEGVPQDQNNAEKLLDFFDKATSLHPESESEAEETDQAASLFDQYRIESLLSEIATADSVLFRDYQKAVREFENEEYTDSIRDIGRAAEKLIEIVSLDVFDEGDRPSHMGGQLNKLDSTLDGMPSFIGKSISPLWWLRNQASHASTYEVGEEEALYALQCFQMAVEK